MNRRSKLNQRSELITQSSQLINQGHSELIKYVLEQINQRFKLILSR
jgi:hypothetical protein